MNVARMLLFFLGGALMIVAVAMLFFETGLSRWIPGSIAAAGLILLVGLLVVGLADRTGPEHHRHVDDTRGDDVTVIRR